jgi:hypothetical protein
MSIGAYVDSSSSFDTGFFSEPTDSQNKTGYMFSVYTGTYDEYEFFLAVYNL